MNISVKSGSITGIAETPTWNREFVRYNYSDEKDKFHYPIINIKLQLEKLERSAQFNYSYDYLILTPIEIERKKIENEAKKRMHIKEIKNKIIYENAIFLAGIGAIITGLAGCGSCTIYHFNSCNLVTDFNLINGGIIGAILGALIGALLGTFQKIES